MNFDASSGKSVLMDWLCRKHVMLELKKYTGAEL